MRQDLGQAQAAAGKLRQALAHFEAQRWQQAEQGAREVLALVPGQPDALHLLGVLASQFGQPQLAVQLISQALPRLLPPASAFAHANLGNAQQALGQGEAALGSYRRALAIAPELLPVRQLLGRLLLSSGQLDEALVIFADLVRLRPADPAALCQLGLAQQGLRRDREAVASYRQALALYPASADTWCNLGLVLLRLGDAPAAEAAFRSALERRPDHADARSSLLLTLQYRPGLAPEALFAEHQRYAQLIEAPLRAARLPHANVADPARLLRVGLVSGDFRDHPVSYLLEPMLDCRDRAQFEWFAYCNNEPDAVTLRLREGFDHWRDVARLGDEDLAALIWADAIDILVDLSGHTGGNRLPVFARRPAPLQLTWLGWPSTTGLEAIDYRLTDVLLDPPGVSEAFHSEQLLRLPAWAPFVWPAESPPVNALPALAGEGLMLACLNNPLKLNPTVIALWSRILHALPTARLMLGNCDDGVARAALLEAFAAEGIGEARLELQPRLSLQDYLALHHRIDLALDPFPFPGGVTTQQSLWMGVPVVTLVGRTTATRQGQALLGAAGLDACIAHDEEDYVARVLALTADLSALDSLRQGLRARLGAVLATRPETVVGAFEAVCRQLWFGWCERQHEGGA